MSDSTKKKKKAAMKSGYVTLKYTGPVGRKATLLFAGCIEMCGCVVWGGGKEGALLSAGI